MRSLTLFNVTSCNAIASTDNAIASTLKNLTLYRAAADAARLAEWEFHNAVLCGHDITARWKRSPFS
ncbi:hypothetical protein [Nostoc sp.]|uniref:hypothetical protein n=1 Tax=Nostoc sp. TaxID=1180 RepID=UPI002FFA3742